MKCKDCKHSYTLDCYKKEHSKGLLFCRNIFTFVKKIKGKKDYNKHIIYIQQKGCYECSGAMEYVNENFGCIHFKPKTNKS
jgi:hypothetical protein